jgi:hypothetical protein
LEEIKDREKILKAVERYKKVSVVGLAKNVGKTTIVNYLAENFLNSCVMTIGRDGEEKDVLDGASKPQVRIKSGNFAVISSKYIPRGIEIVETFDVPSGKVAFVMAKIDSEVQTVRVGGIEFTNNLSNYLLEFCDKIIIDGAFGRTGMASYAEAVIVVTGVAGDLSKNILKIKKLLSRKANREIQEKIFGNENFIVLSVEGNISILDPDEEFQKALEMSKDADFIYIPRVIDESTLSRIKCRVVVPSTDFVLADKVNFEVLRETNVVGIGVNSSSTKNDVNPRILMDELKNIFDDIIIFDVLYDP